MTAHTHRRTGRTQSFPARFFLTTFLLLLSASSLYAVAMPPMSPADESSHFVKALAVTGGQITGEDVRQPPGSYYDIVTLVDVPAYAAPAAAVNGCYVRQPNQSAACAPRLGDGELPLTPTITTAGRYNPLPYALLGWPSHFLAGETAVVGMRLAGSVICSLLTALGLSSLRQSRNGEVAVAGGVLAVTPTALAFYGAVNPSGLEISAAVTVAACLLPIAVEGWDKRSRWRLVAAAAALPVLVNARPASAAVALLICVLAVVLVDRRTWRLLLKEPLFIVVLVSGFLSGAASSAWVLLARPQESLGGEAASLFADTGIAARRSLGFTEEYVRQAIGMAGSLDAPAPVLVLAGWLIISGALLIGAGLVAPRARAAALTTTSVLVLLLPTALQVPSAEELGLPFQGRYLLPFLAVLLVLAGSLLSAALPRGRAATSAGAAADLLLLGLLWAQTLTFWWVLRRYTTGEQGPLLQLDAAWQPPGGTAVHLGLAVVVAVLTTAVLGRRARRPVLAPS